MLPDRSFLIGQKLVENAKIENTKSVIFQTLCCPINTLMSNNEGKNQVDE